MREWEPTKGGGALKRPAPLCRFFLSQNSSNCCLKVVFSLKFYFYLLFDFYFIIYFIYFISCFIIYFIIYTFTYLYFYIVYFIIYLVFIYIFTFVYFWGDVVDKYVSLQAKSCPPGAKIHFFVKIW